MGKTLVPGEIALFSGRVKICYGNKVIKLQCKMWLGKEERERERGGEGEGKTKSLIIEREGGTEIETDKQRLVGNI